MTLEIILAKAGLQKEYTCKEPNSRFWDKSVYRYYTTNEYLSSSRAEADSVYGMFEGHLLHLKTGLRFSMLGTESYYGDEVTYKITSAYILTEGRKRIYIDDLNWDTEIFFSGDEQIPFNQTLKD